MKRLFGTSLAVLALAANLYPSSADAAPRWRRVVGFSVAAPGGACANDGHSGAPAGASIIFASYRSSVAFPPPCQIPDVDFGDGPPAGITYKDPTTNTPAGADAYYAPQNTVGCADTGQAIVIWDGYDFTLHGGVNMLLNGCPHVIVRNSKFAKGTTCANGPKSLSLTADIELWNNDFDGGGATAQASCRALGIDNGELVQLLNNGAHVVKYNRFHDFDQHAINLGGTGTVDEEFNSFSGCGFEQGAHCNGNQFSGAFLDGVTIKFNFFYDPQPTVTSGSLAATCTAGGSVGTVAVTVLSNQGSFRVGQHLTSPCITGTALITGVSDPTVDAALFPQGPDVVTLTLDRNVTTNGSTTATSPDMFPVGIVIALRPQTEAGSTLANLTLSGNVFAGPGPIKGGTSAINCAGVTGTVTIDANYIDFTNYAALAQLTSCGTSHSGTGNIRTDTGVTVAIP